MGSTTDFYQNESVQDIIRDHGAKIPRGQLSTKFGSLPQWIADRLAEAKAKQIERWFNKFVTANTLDGVLGKR